MDNAIKDMTSWAEASSWLAKHGYGMDQIRQQKDLWDAASTAGQVASAAKVKAATDAVAKQAADAAKAVADAAKKVEAAKPVAKPAITK